MTASTLTVPRAPSISRTWIAVIAVAIAQTAVLLYMIWDRANLVATGREIVLDIVPVDPRSLMRGDYVIFSYDISNKPAGGAPGEFRSGEAVHVTIDNASGKWNIAAVSKDTPATVTPTQLVLKGFIVNAWAGEGQRQDLMLRYGIESYFIPEGTGGDLEKLVGEKKMQAIVAVGRDGTAAIKGLVIDGVRRLDPPMF